MVCSYKINENREENAKLISQRLTPLISFLIGVFHFAKEEEEELWLEKNVSEIQDFWSNNNNDDDNDDDDDDDDDDDGENLSNSMKVETYLSRQ